MKALHIALILILPIYLISCANKHAKYVPQTNTYTFDFFNSKNGILLSESLAYTFNVESMEQKYYTTFCAGVKDCTGNINNIKNSPLFDGFDLNQKPISHNKFGITHVDLYRLIYTTTGQKRDLRTVSGAVFIPDIPASKIKGVILYFHKTFFSKTSVPSFDLIGNGPDNNTIASVFATNGYIVIAPDYIGQGIDNTVAHPFILYPLVNTNDGLSILMAAHQFLYKKGFSNSLPLFVTGFSEGASYALWFSRLYQEQPKFKQQTDNTNFKFTLVAPIAGAYDISNVIYHYLSDNVSLWSKETYLAYSSIIASKLKPGLLAFALVGYAFYDEGGDYDKVFAHNFFTMQCTWQNQEKCNYDNKNMNLAELFNQKKDMEIVYKIVNSATYKYYDYHFFTSQTNNIKPLVNPQIVKNKHFLNTFLQADIYYWHSNFPTTLITLKQDSVVSPYNTEYAYRGMLENKSTNLKKIEMDNSLVKANIVDYLPDFDTDHPISLPYVALIALKEFNSAARFPLKRE